MVFRFAVGAHWVLNLLTIGLVTRAKLLSPIRFVLVFVGPRMSDPDDAEVPVHDVATMPWTVHPRLDHRFG